MGFKETRRNVVEWINIHQDGDSGKLSEHSDKSLGSIKCREFLDWLNNEYLFKDFNTWSFYLVSQSVSQAINEAVIQFSWLVISLCTYLPSELSFK